MSSSTKQIWTIGHSTHTIEKFIGILQSFHIEMLVDIRHFPGSRKFPQFNKPNLEIILPENNIGYMHLADLGGRRKVRAHSKNQVWHHPSFRGYADYMETDAFKKAIQILEETGMQYITAYMCAEAVWWRCHRSLVSDYLKVSGWEVWHIMDTGKAVPHPFTTPARIHEGQLSYTQGTIAREMKSSS